MKKLQFIYPSCPIPVQFSQCPGCYIFDDGFTLLLTVTAIIRSIRVMLYDTKPPSMWPGPEPEMSITRSFTLLYSGIVGSIKSSALARLDSFCYPVCRVSFRQCFDQRFWVTLTSSYQLWYGCASQCQYSWKFLGLPMVEATLPFRPMATYLQPCNQLHRF